jgi:hypothetical protein
MAKRCSVHSLRNAGISCHYSERLRVAPNGDARRCRPGGGIEFRLPTTASLKLRSGWRAIPTPRRPGFTTGLYDRRGDDITLDEVEKIGI